MIRETIESNAQNLSGYPDWYWQVYSDDLGPFSFPLPSPAVTKRVGSPHPALALVFRRSRWLLALASGLFLAVSFLPFAVALMASLLLLVVHLVWSYFLLRDVRVYAALSL